MGHLEEFNEALRSKLGFSMRAYQLHVAREILDNLEEGFLVVSMPTGSGKTILELFTAHLLLERGSRVLVLEPTRFLCDQMHEKLWKHVFNAEKEYEGECGNFGNSDIVIATPQTALKCANIMDLNFGGVIIDEVHHALGNRLYEELLNTLNPEFTVGFTALLPRKKLYSYYTGAKGIFKYPTLLKYDFKDLTKIDPNFTPPRAVVDVYDSELNPAEDEIYETLYRGFLWGEPQITFFLERTFVKYGKRAFCESLRRAVENGRVRGKYVIDRLLRFCSSEGFSHKARTLLEILRAYDVEGNEGIKPVIAFTSRKATAYEFKELVEKEVPGVASEVLTSDLSKQERLQLLERAKKGEVDLIISTLVGEEGVDIPEAGLMVMGDTPKSPLRFYQRLGRLIRISSPKKLKYMAVVATPLTFEYQDLGRAIDNLYFEGVDVGYVLYNVEEKSSAKRLLELIKDLSKPTEFKTVPYTLLARGKELDNPFEYYARLLTSSQKSRDSEIWELLAKYGSQNDAALFFLTDYFLRGMDPGVKKVMRSLEKTLSTGSISKEIDGIMLADKAFYIYDSERLSEIIALGIKRLAERCRANLGCSERGFRIDRKGFLRLFARVFPMDEIDEVIGALQEEVKRKEKELKSLIESRAASIDVRGWTTYNPKNYSLAPRVEIKIEGHPPIHFTAQINYYNLPRFYSRTYEKKIELIKLNLREIGLVSMERFLELEEET